MIAAAFATGALFAIGLLLSGMTTPAKVIGFLDVGAAWDPTLAFVMAGAIAVHAPIVFVGAMIAGIAVTRAVRRDR